MSQVPSAIKQLPGELEGDEGLADAGGERQQDTFQQFEPVRRHSLESELESSSAFSDSASAGLRR